MLEWLPEESSTLRRLNDALDTTLVSFNLLLSLLLGGQLFVASEVRSINLTMLR